MLRFAWIALAWVSLLTGCKPVGSTPPPSAATEPEPASPEDPEHEHKVEQALAAFAEGRLDEADGMLSWLAERPPADPRVLGALGRLRLSQSKLELAQARLEEAITLAPGDAELHHALGRVHLAMDRLDEAAQSLTVAYEVDPDQVDLGLVLGRTLLQLGRPDDAEPPLRHVVEIHARAKIDDVGVHTLLGDSLRGQERFEEALRSYMRAQSTHAGDKMAHAGVAMTYGALGNVQLAIDEWSNYVRMDCCSEYARTVAQAYINEAVQRGR